MTNKEKAEEYAGEKCKECYMCDYADNEHPEINPYEVCPWYTKRKEGYLDGLAEGRKEKWHDLRKNPDDLPSHSGLYCVQCGEVREYVKEEKSWFTVHFIPCRNCTEDTFLWCELPTYKE